MSFTLCVLIFGFGKVHAALNDDVAIIRALSGFSGTYPDFLPFTHSLIVWPVVWLHQHIPSIHWYSWLMVGSFYFSVAVIFKSLFQRSADGKWCLALLLGLTSFVLIWLTAAVDLTFTNISTFLGCAAAVQLLSFEADKASTRQMLGAVILAFMLAALGYALRMENLYPILGFCGLAALVQCFSLRLSDGAWQKEKLKHLLCCLSIPVIGLALLVGWRAWECSLSQNQKIMEWQDASEVVMDYQGMGELPEEVLSDIGLTREGAEMVQRWYFLDSAVNTQAFQKLAAYHDETTGKSEGIGQLWQSQVALWRYVGEKSELLAGVIWIGICFLLVCTGRQKVLRHIAEITLVFWLLLMTVLGIRGRLVVRGLLAAVGPEAMLMTMMALISVPFSDWMQWRKRILCVLMAVLALGGAALQSQEKFSADFQLLRAYRLQNLWSFVDEYAVQNPDTLFILNSLKDDRLFPDMKGGKITNVLFYGGWRCQDSDYRAQLSRYGINPDDMDGRLFLQDNVRLVSLDNEVEQAMLAYIQSLCEEMVEAIVEEKFDLFSSSIRVIRYQLKQE